MCFYLLLWNVSEVFSLKKQYTYLNNSANSGKHMSHNCYNIEGILENFSHLYGVPSLTNFQNPYRGYDLAVYLWLYCAVILANESDLKNA